MASANRNLLAYAVNSPSLSVFPQPIVANRAPTANDIAYQLGQIWIFKGSNAYILVNVVGAVATWTIFVGSGTFTSLTVNPGPTALSTVGNGAVTIGNSANTAAVTLVAGVGNLAITGAGHSISIGNDAAANSVTIGSTTAGALTVIDGGDGTGVGTAGLILQGAVAGDIQIGSAAHTGAIDLGVSTAGDTINIANGVNVGAEVVNILNSATGANATVNILSGVGTAGAGVLALGNNTRVTTIGLGNIAPAAARTITIAGGNSAQNDTVNILDGNPSAGTQTVSILSGTATGGTQVLNLGNAGAAVGINIGAGAGVATIHMADSAAAHVVAIGSNTGAASTTIKAGSGGLVLSPASGNASMVPATSSTASPTASVTMNNRVGVATFTGFTTAAAGTQAFVITNSAVLTTSGIFCSVANVHNANDAQLTIQSVVINAAGGAFTVNVKNNGAGALDGNVNISFWIIS